MVHFVGAGPGAADLITLRGLNILRSADVIVYAGSLVNPELLDYAPKGCVVYDSAKLNLKEITDIMIRADKEGKSVVRLQTGDPSIYGAVREQMDILEGAGVSYDSTPGVSSFCGAAAAMNLEYTLPGISQSLVITRMEGRTPVPEKESVESFAKHDSTMVFFLSAGDIKGLTGKLMAAGRDKNTPCAVIYKATWPDEKRVEGCLSDIALKAQKEGIDKTALIIVGDVVGAATGSYERSKLYDPEFTTAFRKGTKNND